MTVQVRPGVIHPSRLFHSFFGGESPEYIIRFLPRSASRPDHVPESGTQLGRLPRVPFSTYALLSKGKNDTCTFRIRPSGGPPHDSCCVAGDCSTRGTLGGTRIYHPHAQGTRCITCVVLIFPTAFFSPTHMIDSTFMNSRLLKRNNASSHRLIRAVKHLC